MIVIASQYSVSSSLALTYGTNGDEANGDEANTKILLGSYNYFLIGVVPLLWIFNFGSQEIVHIN